MKNALQEIVNKEVKRNYTTEKGFYTNVLGISRQAWQGFKRGEFGLKNENMAHLKSLFTPYEWMIAQKVGSDMAVYPQNFKEDPYMVYLNAKMEIAKQWAESGAVMSVESARNVDDPKDGRKQVGTRFSVSFGYDVPLINSKDVLTFNIDVPYSSVPSGKQNRLEWFQENFENVVM